MRIKTTFHVVGSGMGGSSIAIRLAEMGFHVVLIDIDELNQNANESFESVGIDFRHESTLSYELGGGSNLWHGVTAPLDAEDFTKGVGLTKFIPYEEMSEYWKMASNFLGFTNNAIVLDNIKSASIRIMASDFPYNKLFFKPKLYKVLRRPIRFKSKLLDLESRGLLTILRNSHVKRINLDESKNKVNSITVNISGDNFCSDVEVENLILCSGSINTVRILLNSESFKEGATFNSFGLIGRGYFDHPMGFLGKIVFDKPLLARMYSDLPVDKNEKLRLGLVPIDTIKYGNTNIYFRPSTSVANSRENDSLLISLIKIKGISDINLKLIWLILTNPNVLIRGLLNKYSLPIKYRAADIFFVSEQTFNYKSRVRLGNKKDEFGFSNVVVDWRISSFDYQKINNLFNLIVDSYSKISGLRLIDPPTLDGWKKVHTSAAHHLGGLLVGDCIENSTVDKNLQFHGLKNLWVCDGSVFPAIGNSNPSLTIIALAMRLANFLKNKFQ